MTFEQRTMVSFRLFLSPILLLMTIVLNTLAQPQPEADLPNHFCSKDKGNYTIHDSYSQNLNHLLSSLPYTGGNGFGFYNSSYSGNTTSDAIYAIGLCKGDIGTTDCLQCLNTSTSALMELCPIQKEAIIWYDNCMLRYSNRSMYGVMETLPVFDLWSTQSVPPSKFDLTFRNLTILLGRLIIEAAAGGPLKFAEGYTIISDYSNDPLYSEAMLTAFVQCTPDLSELECRSCLFGDFEEGYFEELPKCCDGKEGGRVLRPSCNFNYQLTNTTPPHSDSDSVDGHGRNRRMVRFLVLFATIVGVGMIAVGGIYMSVRTTRPQPTSGLLDLGLQFDCADIRAATNNYSEENKLRDDAYGTVYRGSLSNEKMVAVRRLTMNYVKEYMEIRKEVLLIAPKLRHPNIVELLGCALEKNSERLLVYELFPNSTLDKIIFDQIKSRQWDWEMRYNIIVSIARGLLHLHYSQFVHGNVNARNILIDAQINPKISSFGMERFFTVDQTHSSTNGIDMLNLITNTYMAPEAIDGHSSTESDVYSFGVLVVEIVSGQEISSLPSAKLNETDLLSCAWKNWAEGTIRNLIDPTLWTGPGIELMKSCIRIGLFCMQRTKAVRPTMSSVIQMLSHSSAVRPVPRAPPYKYRHGSFGIIGVSRPITSKAKVRSFIAKMRTSIMKKISLK